MPITVHTTPIDGLVVIEPKVYRDHRGFFLESFNSRELTDAGIAVTFVQDNLSFSVQNTVRGLHFQAPPHAQAKLVTCLQGHVRDVAVDIRKGSPTYGQVYVVDLTAENHLQFYIPAGFAHGFSVLSETALFSYKCSAYYDKPSDGGIRWNDPALAIDWGVSTPLLSDKDQVLPFLTDFDTPF